MTLERDSLSMCTPLPHGCIRGSRFVGLVLVAPGLNGGRVAMGGGWIAEPLTGVTGTLSVMRTWRAAGQVSANQTFAGPSVTAYLWGLNMDVTSYWRLFLDVTGESWFASFRMGVGF